MQAAIRSTPQGTSSEDPSAFWILLFARDHVVGGHRS